MKLVCLNTYGGAFFEPLINFIRERSFDADVFCFQEILNAPPEVLWQGKARANLFFELQSVLKDFSGWFASAEDNFIFFGDTPAGVPAAPHGLAMFINKKYPVKECGDFFIYRGRNTFIPRDFKTLGHNAQFARFMVGKREITIYNVHGQSEPGDKLDSAERLKQSQIILDHAASRAGESVIAGDFNLLPYTKSIGMFSDAGYRNLVDDYKITTTRGSMLKKLHPEYAGTPQGYQEFADYVFVSRGVKPTSFTVPDLPVSDHLPLILEFNL